MRNSKTFFAAAAAALLLTACARSLPGKPVTAESFAIVKAKLELLQKEERKFDASHILKGQIANTAIRQLQNEGYACNIGYVDHVNLTKDLTFYTVPTPLVFCMMGSSDPHDFCRERHANLNIGWEDPKAPEQELRLQLASSVITDRHFRCVELSEVGRKY